MAKAKDFGIEIMEHEKDELKILLEWVREKKQGAEIVLKGCEAFEKIIQGTLEGGWYFGEVYKVEALDTLRKMVRYIA